MLYSRRYGLNENFESYNEITNPVAAHEMNHSLYAASKTINVYKYPGKLYMSLQRLKGNQLVLIILATLASSGCATIEGPTEPHDPFESYNRAIYSFNEDFDEAIGKPVAEFYRDTLPNPVNKGITNFFSNIHDVSVLANAIMQLKGVQALQDTARIFFNTTIGLAGFIDVATYMDLPKHNEDFGQTLGYWGVPSGPYFVLPFFGPSTIRDSTGLAVDYALFYPVFNRIDNTTVQWSLFALDLIDQRADLLGASKLLEVAALDPYVFTREAYLQRRQYFVYDGDPPMEDFDDEEIE
jgi:phospholipid-binding lipoprotein MlaA